MPGSKSKQRRAQRRKKQRTLQREEPIDEGQRVLSQEEQHRDRMAQGLLPALTALPAGSIRQGQGSREISPYDLNYHYDGTLALRLAIGHVAGLGPYGSAFRKLVVDNLLCSLLSELFPWLAAVQFLPDPGLRSSPSCHLLLYFGTDRPSRLALFTLTTGYNTNVLVHVLPSGLLASSAANPGRLLAGLPARPPPHAAYQPRSLPPASAQHPGTAVRLPSFETVDLPEPSCVTVKIRGLDFRYHRPGVTAAFLEASGYDPTSFSVRQEHYPPIRVHGEQPLRAGVPGAHVLDCSIIMASVFPPPDDPCMSRASLQWLLPGHSHKVRVTVLPPWARPVSGGPVCPPPPPLPVRAQRPLSEPDPWEPRQRCWTPAPAPQRSPATAPVAGPTRSLRPTRTGSNDAPSAARQGDMGEEWEEELSDAVRRSLRLGLRQELDDMGAVMADGFSGADAAAEPFDLYGSPTSSDYGLW